jgi:hypothetical protein
VLASLSSDVVELSAGVVQLNSFVNEDSIYEPLSHISLHYLDDINGNLSIHWGNPHCRLPNISKGPSFVLAFFTL